MTAAPPPATRGTAVPAYVTTARGQVRLWTDGTGPTLVVVAGLTRSARVLGGDLRRALPGWRVVAVDPPGVGGSAGAASSGVQDAAAAVAQALSFLDGEPCALVCAELSGALAPALTELLAPAVTVLLDPDSACGWVDTGVRPPAPGPRDDGTHLTALWSFLRDRRLLRADNPGLPRTDGAPLPSTEELSAGFVDAMTDPVAFARVWGLCSSALPAALAALPDAPRVGLVDDLAGVLPVLAASSARPGPTAPLAGTAVWHEYRDTATGRVHLRRAGSQGRPVLVLPTGGGSSAQFAPVLSGLARSRTAVAVDWHGNGLSEPLDRTATAATLAEEAFAVADALDWDVFDLWGSHTGACVALEMAVTRPERIGRAVLEAPVMVTPEFREDLLAHYFPDLAPHPFGLHVQQAWHWRRDMFMYWPWYAVEHGATRALGVPSAEDLQLYAVGILQSGTTYDGAYRAGFGYDTRSRLPLLRVPAILTAGPDDMLANALDDAASLVPGGLLEIRPTPTTMWWPAPDPEAAARTLAAYRDFLG